MKYRMQLICYAARTADYQLIINRAYNEASGTGLDLLRPVARRVLSKAAPMALQDIRTPTLGQALRPNIWDVVEDRMRGHFSRKQLFVRVGLLVFLIAAVCLGIFSLFQRLSSS
jgi:hypothetical protein